MNDEFRCPILGLNMGDPIIMSDGYTYERSVINEHLLKTGKSPIDNMNMSITQAIPNITLKTMIEK
jgi:hypothetical protein